MAGAASSVLAWPRSGSKSPRARLFVALDLPQDVRAGLVDWQQTALADPALRIVAPDALHITLVFLGYQAEKEVKAIARSAFAVQAEAPAVELAAEPVGIPRGKRPRLIAVARELGGDGGPAAAGGGAPGCRAASTSRRSGRSGRT